VTIPDAIDTERLILRPLGPTDERAFVDFMTDVSTTTEFMFVDEQKTSSGARAFFGSILASYETSSPYLLFAILARHGASPFGLCGISPLPGYRVFECFCCLKSESRGHGYATEALERLVAYCLQKGIADEFHCYINPRNERSLRLAERLGYERRGMSPHPLTGERCVMYVVPCVMRER
jgi:RimJ/RimL family protein N-acetyltransferase